MADIITPNLTEACILTDSEYHEGDFDIREIETIAWKLKYLGAGNIVITGIEKNNNICNFILTDNKSKLLEYPLTGGSHAGTGDVFASIISADAVNRIDFEESVKKSAEFVSRCVELSDKMQIPVQDGVCFEEILDLLM